MALRARGTCELMAAFVGAFGLSVSYTSGDNGLLATQRQVDALVWSLVVDGAVVLVHGTNPTRFTEALHHITTVGLGIGAGLAIFVLPYAEHLPFAEVASVFSFACMSVLLHVAEFLP